MFFLLALTARLAQAQCCPYVRPVEVLPANPTATDEIRLVFQAATGNAGQEISALLSRVGNSFTFTGCYYSGFLTMPQSYVDTVRVGRLPAGSYTVTFVAKESSSSQQCLEHQRNGTSRTFQVGGASLGIDSPDQRTNALFPVPAVGRQLAFSAVDGSAVTGFKLFDATGRGFFTQTTDDLPYQNGHYLLNLPQLPAGTYTLQVHRVGLAPTTHRVVLQ